LNPESGQNTEDSGENYHHFDQMQTAASGNILSTPLIGPDSTE